MLLVSAVIIVGFGGLCSVGFGMRVRCGCLVVFSSLDMVLYGLLGHVYILS